MSADDTDENAHAYETEDSFHPLGAEWESEMRGKLEETDFDADLGMQMARDAQRLVAGEITEDAFYDKYHEDVSEEFDVDERPVFDDVDLDDADPEEFSEAGGESLLSLDDIDLEGDEQSRREVMKKMGAGAAFLGYGAYASVQDQEKAPEISGITHPSKDERQHRWGMVIDLERCDGCLACVSGCVDENATSTGANWMYVMPYKNKDTEQQNFLVRPCQHCSNAPCAKVCPVRARHTREKDGLVLTDYETCIGCRYCQVACPYGVNYFQWGEPDVPLKDDEGEQVVEHAEISPSEAQSLDMEERQKTLSEANDHIYDYRGRWADSRPPKGVMGKCTMCPSRQDQHTDNPKGTVACQDACDSQGMSAIHFGDLDDPESRPNQYLDRRSEEQLNDGANEFDGESTIPVNGDESIDVEPGRYPMYFIERQTGSGMSPWSLISTHSVLVAEQSGEYESSEQYADSSIRPISGVPGNESNVLAPGESAEVTFDLVFGEDSFENATERDVDVELVLAGSETQTLATDTVTLSEENADTISRTIPQKATVTTDAVDVPAEEPYELYLLVETDGSEGSQLRSAARTVVYVSDEASIDRPDAPYDDTRLEASLEAPDTLFAGESTEVGYTVAYPNRPAEHEFRLVLDDGSIDGREDTGDTIGSDEFTFSQTLTSNTPWKGKLSSFRLLEDLGTEPNITYLGNEPGPKAHQNEGPVSYEDISSSEWNEWQDIISERAEHLDYGAGARKQTGTNYE